jgi:prophage maintenance system killer protein
LTNKVLVCKNPVKCTDRSAAIVDVFLRLNGFELTADELDAVDTIQALAAGDLGEDELAAWISAHSAPIAKT